MRVFLFAAALLLAGCNLFETLDTSISSPDMGAADAELDQEPDRDLPGDASVGDADANDADANDADYEYVVPSLPQATEHVLGFVEGKNEQWPQYIDAYLRFEKLVYPEDRLVVYSNSATSFPTHDLFLNRTGGNEPLVTHTEPIIVFAPWGLDDMKMATLDGPNYIADVAKFALTESGPFFDAEDEPFELYLDRPRTIWLQESSTLAPGIRVLMKAEGDEINAAVLYAQAGASDIDGAAFAGDRVGFLATFEDSGSDARPTWHVWSLETWRAYRAVRDHFLEDAIDQTRTATMVFAELDFGACAFVSRLERLGFKVSLVTEDQWAGPESSDLHVIWSDVTSSIVANDLEDVETPVLAFNTSLDVLVVSGFLTNVDPVVTDDFDWIFEDTAFAEGGQVSVVDYETQSILPDAEPAAYPPGSIPEDALTISRTESQDVTSFAIPEASQVGRRALIAADSKSYARAEPPLVDLIDRLVLWLAD